MVPRLRGLVCVPLEVGTIDALAESLAVTPYQRVLCNGLVVSLLVISPKESVMNNWRSSRLVGKDVQPLQSVKLVY